MGFTDVRRRVIKALQTGSFEHEARDVLSERNLLAIGEVDEPFVIKLLHRCRGDQYRTSPHHWDADTTVHEFKPVVEDEQWYAKVYFLESSRSRVTFISIHKSE